MKVGFIGLGNMATAIIGGLLEKGVLTPKNIHVASRTFEKVQAFSEKTGITAVQDAGQLVRDVDVLILAVKPNMFQKVLAPLREDLQASRPLVISIAAGLTLDQLAELTGGDHRIVRVMPNVNATIGESMSGICANSFVTEKDLQAAEMIFGAVGKTMVLDESEFSIFAAIAGSSPAFIYLFIDSLARGALKAGMPKQKAVEIVAQTVLGSAKMVLESGEHPFSLIDKVCSPGGTTIAGVAALEDEAFISAVMKSVEATIAREKEMTENS
ncbi:pyrroline-5-carboxylate reductase [Listeria costaricensis]|uniref:pyrroline-5-carboxylate reductase n=1 Tax=Listeria costaricensis TaxID=2026604 RepID=UPI000C079826|nr:pyrroline-5-carboxylate reductase [Listeria costaricensis]